MATRWPLSVYSAMADAVGPQATQGIQSVPSPGRSTAMVKLTRGLAPPSRSTGVRTILPTMELVHSSCCLSVLRCRGGVRW